MPLTKKKEKIDVTQGKGIELLYQVALTEEAQFKEVRKKSMRDFHKTHPSGSGTVTKTAPSGNDEDDNNNKHDSSGEDNDQENDSDDDKTQSDNENESHSEHETDESESGSESDHEENEEDKDDEEEVKDEFVKTPSNDYDDKAEGDEDEEMDYTTTQLYDNEDIRLNELVDTDKGFVQEEGINAAMTNVQQGNENPKILQVIEDSYIFPIQMLKLFLQWMFTSIKKVTTLEKEVAKLKKVPLHTQVIALVDDHLDERLGATKDEFMKFLSTSLTMVKESLEDVVPAKESSQPQSSYEATAMFKEFELKKILINKMDKSKSYLAAPEHRECYEGLKKSYDLDKNIFSTYEEPEFEVANSDTPQDQEENSGNDNEKPKKKVPVDYFFNNNLKYLQGGISTITYMTSLTKTKATQYDLPGIKDIVPNIWSPVKVAYDKHALWGILHWREKRKTFYGYARGLQSKHDVYSTKCIMLVTQVEVMRKDRHGYLQEIVDRRADNDLYRFKEGDFPRLCINDIEDMLQLVVQNWLTNLSGDDVFNFTIALRMFTKSLVIQKRERDPYTSYQDHQGFIYVDNSGRNMLMRSDELYKFCDGTLTRLQTSLGDITKNIRMEYLPKRRWSTLEKKRVNIMIKAIGKLLKERRIMRSLKKFVGGIEYGTDLQLLQQTI
uniref:Reverse transcriptase Ty1/copia-type domain-containing protein n=1 Tax=Tanacetum cinerariifolium TaxID=118510 RepID=A0A6L2LWH6_TANCI|nr:hypothetical protein [Tanacetum cinerariifolium]